MNINNIYIYIYNIYNIYNIYKSHINNEPTPSRNNVFRLITQYNPMIPNIKTIFKKYLPVLHSNQEMLRIFPENIINVTYKKKET